MLVYARLCSKETRNRTISLMRWDLILLLSYRIKQYLKPYANNKSFAICTPKTLSIVLRYEQQANKQISCDEGEHHKHKTTITKSFFFLLFVYDVGVREHVCASMCMSFSSCLFYVYTAEKDSFFAPLLGRVKRPRTCYIILIPMHLSSIFFLLLGSGVSMTLSHHIKDMALHACTVRIRVYIFVVLILLLHSNHFVQE